VARDLEQRLDEIQKHPEQNLGFIEEALARSSREPLRLLAQRAAQAKANATPCLCSRCQIPLHREQVLRAESTRVLAVCRSIAATPVPRMRDVVLPADLALGLNKNSPASPICRSDGLGSTPRCPRSRRSSGPPLGPKLSRCFIHREAHRQGLKAEASPPQPARTTGHLGADSRAGGRSGSTASAPFTLVIEIDAWNIRERDDWGRSEQARQQALRQNKEVPSKWHWVYVATVFRLDHRGQTAGGRPIISQRGYVCTRLGTPISCGNSTVKPSTAAWPSSGRAGHRRWRRLDLEGRQGPLFQRPHSAGSLPCR